MHAGNPLCRCCACNLTSRVCKGGCATLAACSNKICPWLQRPEIDNPEFEEDPEVYLLPPLKFVGFEIWQVKAGEGMPLLQAGWSCFASTIPWHDPAQSY